MAKLTASEVPLTACDLMQDYDRRRIPWACTIAALLSDPAIQRLVVQKCVEGMSGGALRELSNAIYYCLPQDWSAILLATICPTEPNDA